VNNAPEPARRYKTMVSVLNPVGSDQAGHIVVACPGHLFVRPIGFGAADTVVVGVGVLGADLVVEGVMV